MSINISKYRDELVRTIKCMGQELIDRAESMVHDDCELITNFNINIDIPNLNEGSPELTWSTSVVSKNFYSKELGHSAGDAKMETHVETVTVEKTKTKTPVYICKDAASLSLHAVFDNRNDAEACLESMTRICDLYGYVTEADLYDLCAIPGISDTTRGWTTTANMSVVTEKEDHILILSNPIPLI